MKAIFHNDSRGWGGYQKWILTLAQGLSARGHEVVVACHAGSPLDHAVREAGIRTDDRHPGADVNLPKAWRFRRWLRRERPDALILTAWKRTFWAGWAGQTAGVRRVLARMGILEPVHTRADRRFGMRHWLDGVIVNTPEIKEHWLRSVPGFPPDDVHMILNGVGTAVPEPAALRAELGIAPEERIVVAAGRLVEQKGFDLLLDAFARLDRPGVHLVIAGEGEEEAELRAHADCLGVAGRVHWLGFRSDVRAVLAAADIFALSSRREGMANVMLEAMAVGTPVVAVEVSGVREALGSEGDGTAAGWIVPPCDPVALAAALDGVLAALASQPESVRLRTEEARRRVVERFGVERMIRETEAVLFGPVAGGAQ